MCRLEKGIKIKQARYLLQDEYKLYYKCEINDDYHEIIWLMTKNNICIAVYGGTLVWEKLIFIEIMFQIVLIFHLDGNDNSMLPNGDWK